MPPVMATPDPALQPRPRPAPARAKRPASTSRRRAVQPESQWQRWAKIAVLVGLVLLGIPIADALAGEVVALLGAAILFGFLLGRWTAPR